MGELAINSVDKIYRPARKAPVHAVQSVSFNVAPGEITALLGSSGCGKTSILRMIAGFEDVSNGSIALDGKDIHKLPPVARGVAMAFETYSLYPPLTNRENMAFALKAQRLSASESNKRVNEMAEMLEISDILSKYPSAVSGGEQQRVSLGRALVRRANLYLLDEPMGQLEPQLRAMLRGRLKRYLREHHCTTILVTHDQTEANALADRIAVMEGGVLQQYATPAELKVRPANLFTGTFIGEPPMNVFRARVSAKESSVDFALDGGDVLSFPNRDLSTDVRSVLSQHTEVIVGVRPHALHLGKGELNGKVVSSQWLGDQTHVAVVVAGNIVVAVSHERVSLKPGSAARLSVAARDIHIFDPVSGRALVHGSAVA